MNAPRPKLVLTREDKASKLWAKLLTHFDEKLALLRTQNDGDKSDVDTANLRGRIAEVKAFMALDKDLPDLEAPPR